MYMYIKMHLVMFVCL